MFYRLPRNISRLYKEIGFFPLLHTVIKWALTPFEKMEEYIPKKGKILDLGCGNGLFSNYLAIKCQDREITGLDYSTKRISIARKTIQGRKNIAFSLGHIESIKLSPCDCIIFSDFLHHLSYQNQEELIRCSFESLNQDGILIIKEIDKHPIISLGRDSLPIGFEAVFRSG